MESISSFQLIIITNDLLAAQGIRRPAGANWCRTATSRPLQRAACANRRLPLDLKELIKDGINRFNHYTMLPLPSRERLLELKEEQWGPLGEHSERRAADCCTPRLRGPPWVLRHFMEAAQPA